MQNVFITKIHIDKVRHLVNIDIPLSETECKHLILTGKNGSGKTSLLEAIRDFIFLRQRQSPHASFNVFNIHLKNGSIPSNPLVSVDFSKNAKNLLEVTFAYFSAERSDLEIPQSVEVSNRKEKTLIAENASKDFLKYILNLYVQYLSAKDSGRPQEEVAQYKSWFDRFEQNLREIYDCQELELKPDMKNLGFFVEMPGREPFGLHQMSDGYKALLEIVMELLVRFENTDGIVDYDQSAIVLIDEIETHLHVELQKRALPFLTKMFPSVQFIVATHSPFVITSLSNAVVYDLEKRESLENPSYYSYESVTESFLDTDMYSEEMKQQFDRYKELCFKNRTDEENEEFLKAKTELERMAPVSKELFIAFQNLERQRKAAKNGQTH
jgi:predicted ATP-binding protein involved in virulence